MSVGEDALSIVRDDLDDLKEVIYKGNHKPGLISRIEIAEDKLMEINKTINRWERVAWTLLVASLVGLLRFIGDIFGAHLMGK